MANKNDYKALVDNVYHFFDEVCKTNGISVFDALYEIRYHKLNQNCDNTIIVETQNYNTSMWMSDKPSIITTRAKTIEIMFTFQDERNYLGEKKHKDIVFSEYQYTEKEKRRFSESLLMAYFWEYCNYLLEYKFNNPEVKRYKDVIRKYLDDNYEGSRYISNYMHRLITISWRHRDYTYDEYCAKRRGKNEKIIGYFVETLFEKLKEPYYKVIIHIYPKHNEDYKDEKNREYLDKEIIKARSNIMFLYMCARDKKYAKEKIIEMLKEMENEIALASV